MFSSSQDNFCIKSVSRKIGQRLELLLTNSHQYFISAKRIKKEHFRFYSILIRLFQNNSVFNADLPVASYFNYKQISKNCCSISSVSYGVGRLLSVQNGAKILSSYLLFQRMLFSKLNDRRRCKPISLISFPIQEMAHKTAIPSTLGTNTHQEEIEIVSHTEQPRGLKLSNYMYILKL